MLLAEQTWKAVHEMSKDVPVLVPIAALEQHGHHLPVFTDSMLLGEVVRRANDQLGAQALFTPLQWLGNSHHHMDFAGTLSAPPRVYLDLLCGLMENLLTHGFCRLLFINGHGGNIVPGKQAVFETRQRHRARNDLLLLFASYWDLGGRPQAHDPRFQQAEREVGHACEFETSMMLRLAPQLVGEIKQLAAVPFGAPFDPAYRGWITKDRTVPGHIGDPRHATAEKGEFLLSAFAAGVVDLARQMGGWDGRPWA